MLSMEETGALWTMRSDNYNSYVSSELVSVRSDAWTCSMREALGEGACSVLDCGCGPGYFTILLSQAGYEVTGIDLSERMLEHARENAKKAGVSACFLKRDCACSGFESASFDGVISRNLTHIFTDHEKVYAEWLRILKPGGILVIYDANWHLPYVPGKIREAAIENEKKCLDRYGSNFSCEEGPLEYIGSSLYREEYAALKDVLRPDFDRRLLIKTGFEGICTDLDVTKELWSEKEKLMYAATPMFRIRAQKPGATA